MAPVQDSDVETGGSRAFLDFALAELTGLFGSAIATHLRPLVATRWASDPFALAAAEQVIARDESLRRKG